MMRYLTIIIIIVIAFSLATNLSFAEKNDSLSIFTSHKSIAEGEKFTLSGKLKDRNWNPISNTEIIIWENDGGKNTNVAYTKTNANGEYTVTVTAKYWDGVGNSAELYAFAGARSVQSSIITVDIKEPNSYNSGSSSVSSTYTPKITNYDTQLSLQVQDSSSHGYVKVKPILTYGSGYSLSADVSIYVDWNLKRKVPSNQWTSNIYVGPGSHTVQASVGEITNPSNSLIKYKSSSDTVNYFIKAATNVSPSTTTPTSATNTTSNDTSFPMEYVIVGIIIAAVIGGIGIALSKRKKIAPVMSAQPAKIQTAPDETQFWVCPHCGNDTQYRNQKQFCSSCNVYL